MGDRANVVVKQPQRLDCIYLYTHWFGSELPEIVRMALASPEGRGRWNDHAYLARIVFCAITREAETAGNRETGYGISTTPCDNDSYPFLVVDTETQTVSFEPSVDHTQTHKAYSFLEYCDQKKAHWPNHPEDECARENEMTLSHPRLHRHFDKTIQECPMCQWIPQPTDSDPDPWGEWGDGALRLRLHVKHLCEQREKPAGTDRE